MPKSDTKRQAQRGLTQPSKKNVPVFGETQVGQLQIQAPQVANLGVSGGTPKQGAQYSFGNLQAPVENEELLVMGGLIDGLSKGLDFYQRYQSRLAQTNEQDLRKSVNEIENAKYVSMLQEDGKTMGPAEYVSDAELLAEAYKKSEESPGSVIIKELTSLDKIARFDSAAAEVNFKSFQFDDLRTSLGSAFGAKDYQTYLQGFNTDIELILTSTSSSADKISQLNKIAAKSPPLIKQQIRSKIAQIERGQAETNLNIELVQIREQLKAEQRDALNKARQGDFSAGNTVLQTNLLDLYDVNDPLVQEQVAKLTDPNTPDQQREEVLSNLDALSLAKYEALQSAQSDLANFEADFAAIRQRDTQERNEATTVRTMSNWTDRQGLSSNLNAAVAVGKTGGADGPLATPETIIAGLFAGYSQAESRAGMENRNQLLFQRFPALQVSMSGLGVDSLDESIMDRGLQFIAANILTARNSDGTTVLQSADGKSLEVDDVIDMLDRAGVRAQLKREYESKINYAKPSIEEVLQADPEDQMDIAISNQTRFFLQGGGSEFRVADSILLGSEVFQMFQKEGVLTKEDIELFNFDTAEPPQNLLDIFEALFVQELDGDFSQARNEVVQKLLSQFHQMGGGSAEDFDPETYFNAMRKSIDDYHAEVRSANSNRATQFRQMKSDIDKATNQFNAADNGSVIRGLTTEGNSDNVFVNVEIEGTRFASGVQVDSTFGALDNTPTPYASLSGRGQVPSINVGIPGTDAHSPERYIGNIFEWEYSENGLPTPESIQAFVDKPAIQQLPGTREEKTAQVLKMFGALKALSAMTIRETDDGPISSFVANVGQLSNQDYTSLSEGLGILQRFSKGIDMDGHRLREQQIEYILYTMDPARANVTIDSAIELGRTNPYIKEYGFRMVHEAAKRAITGQESSLLSLEEHPAFITAAQSANNNGLDAEFSQLINETAPKRTRRLSANDSSIKDALKMVIRYVKETAGDTFDTKQPLTPEALGILEESVGALKPLFFEGNPNETVEGAEQQFVVGPILRAAVIKDMQREEINIQESQDLEFNIRQRAALLLSEPGAMVKSLSDAFTTVRGDLQSTTELRALLTIGMILNQDRQIAVDATSLDDPDTQATRNALFRNFNAAVSNNASTLSSGGETARSVASLNPRSLSFSVKPSTARQLDASKRYELTDATGKKREDVSPREFLDNSVYEIASVLAKTAGHKVIDPSRRVQISNNNIDARDQTILRMDSNTTTGNYAKFNATGALEDYNSLSEYLANHTTEFADIYAGIWQYLSDASSKNQSPLTIVEQMLADIQSLTTIGTEITFEATAGGPTSSSYPVTAAVIEGNSITQDLLANSVRVSLTGAGSGNVDRRDVGEVLSLFRGFNKTRGGIAVVGTEATTLESNTVRFKRGGDEVISTSFAPAGFIKPGDTPMQALDQNVIFFPENPKEEIALTNKAGFGMVTYLESAALAGARTKDGKPMTLRGQNRVARMHLQRMATASIQQVNGNLRDNGLMPTQQEFNQLGLSDSRGLVSALDLNLMYTAVMYENFTRLAGRNDIGLTESDKEIILAAAAHLGQVLEGADSALGFGGALSTGVETGTYQTEESNAPFFSVVKNEDEDEARQGNAVMLGSINIGRTFKRDKDQNVLQNLNVENPNRYSLTVENPNLGFSRDGDNVTERFGIYPLEIPSGKIDGESYIFPFILTGFNFTRSGV